MTSIDYTATYIKYPTPNTIHGEPTNEMLKGLNTELRANSSSVDTNLGGGDHVYLGLILADQEYLRITPIPTQFQAPTWPGTFIIAPAATAVETMHSK